MARLLRIAMAFAMLPLAWGAAVAFVAVFRLASGEDSLPIMSALGGIVAHVLVWLVLPKPIRAYVLGHELTHAVCALCFGAKVGKLKVGLNGGSVLVSKSNLLITLSPYIFPFYAALVAIAALVTSACLGRLPCAWGWYFALGYAWCFHFCFTVRSLTQHQSDVEEYGYCLSYVFIFTVNALVAGAGVVCLSQVEWGAFFALVWRHTADAAVAAWQVAQEGVLQLARWISTKQG